MTTLSPLDATVASLTASWSAVDAPGGAIALFDASGIKRSWCFGLADMASGRAWSLDTPTRLASISKHIVATAAFRLGLEGRLGDTLGELAPPVADATIARALTMTSGIPDLGETLTLSGVSWMSGLDAERLFALACRIDHLNFTAGTEVSYSNTNTRLVHRVIERRTGMPLRRWLRESFFTPLGLPSFALVENQSEFVAGLATGYWLAEDGWRVGWYGMHYSGSGGIVASARDLANWLRALAAGTGPLAGAMRALQAPGVLMNGTTSSYARGLTLHDIGGRVFLGHGGSLPGYKDHCLVDPTSGLGIVVLSNREDTEAQPAAVAILAAHLGVTLDQRRPAAIPTGLFVDPKTGYTLELADGARGTTAAFLGAEEKLFLAADGAWTSHSAHLPIRIAPAAIDTATLRASVGHAAMTDWQRAGGAGAADFVGIYRCAALDVRHEIIAGTDGLALRLGGGPTPDAGARLTPTAPDCFTTQLAPIGPWRLRPALKLARAADGAVRGFTLSSNRSRGWWFERL